MLAIPSQTAAPAAMLSSAGFAVARLSPRSAGVCSLSRCGIASSPGPVPAPGPHATFGAMFAESLRSSNRLTRSADRSASRTPSRPFADLRFRRPMALAPDWFFVTIRNGSAANA